MIRIVRGQPFQYTWDLIADAHVYFQVYDPMSGWAGPRWEALADASGLYLSLSESDTAKALTGTFRYRLFTEEMIGDVLAQRVLDEGEVEILPGERRTQTGGSCWVVRDADGRIIAVGDGLIQPMSVPPGGTQERWAVSAEEFLGRFTCDAPSQVEATSGGTVEVVIRCPERAGRTVWVLVNESLEIEVPIDSSGVGTLTLDASAPAVYVVEPAEQTFAPVGNGVARVEVV